MHIHFFIQVMNYLKQVSEDGVLLKKYTKLDDTLKSAATTPEKDLSEEIATATVQLVKHLLHTDPGDLGYDANRLFEIIDNNKVYGKPAADNIEALLASVNPDYAAIQNEISKKIKVLFKQSNAIGRFYEIFDKLILTDILNLSIKEELLSGLNIRFEGKVTVRNFKDLERYTRIWDGILQSFSDLVGNDKQELEFGNLQNGYIVLGVVTEGKNMEAFMKGTMGILDALDNIMRIRKIQDEIAQLTLQNDYFSLMEDDIQFVIHQISHKVTDELISEYYQGLPENSNIIAENLNRSLKQILNFIEKGGKMESRPSSGISEVDELSKQFNEVFIYLDHPNHNSSTSILNTTSSESTIAHIY